MAAMSLKFAILGLLTDGPKTGYELQKSFGGSIGHFWQAKFQQTYGELRRLETAGLVEKEEVAQRGRPAKKVYSVTPKGQAALDAWLDTPSPMPPVRAEFLVKVFSFGRLPPDRAVARLEEHRRLHAERLETYRGIEARLRESGWISATGVEPPLLGRYLTLRCGMAYEESMLAWCDWAVKLVRRSTSRRLSPARRRGGKLSRSRR